MTIISVFLGFNWRVTSIIHFSITIACSHGLKVLLYTCWTSAYPWTWKSAFLLNDLMIWWRSRQVFLWWALCGKLSKHLMSWKNIKFSFVRSRGDGDWRLINADACFIFRTFFNHARYWTFRKLMHHGWLTYQTVEY